RTKVSDASQRRGRVPILVGSDFDLNHRIATKPETLHVIINRLGDLLEMLRLTKIGLHAFLHLKPSLRNNLLNVAGKLLRDLPKIACQLMNLVHPVTASTFQRSAVR